MPSTHLKCKPYYVADVNLIMPPIFKFGFILRGAIWAELHPAWPGSGGFDALAFAVRPQERQLAPACRVEPTSRA